MPVQLAKCSRLEIESSVQDRCDPDLTDVLVIAVCTLLCGGAGFDDMADFGRAKHAWFKTFLQLRNSIPSHDTFNRVLAALQPEAFLDCFLRWTARRCAGRCAWAQGNGLVLGQLKVAEQSNEITALPQLLRVVESVRQVGTAEPTVERRYSLSRLAVDMGQFAWAGRGHWSVENSLHWCLDVQLGEDQSRARTGHAAENLATLRRLALNLLKRDKTKSAASKANNSTPAGTTPISSACSPFDAFALSRRLTPLSSDRRIIP